MVDEAEKENKRDLRAPIWNEDRTAMIQYVDLIVDKEFGGKKYKFTFSNKTGWFTLSQKNSGFSFDDYLKKIGYTNKEIFNMPFFEYNEKMEQYLKEYGIRIEITQLYFSEKK